MTRAVTISLTLGVLVLLLAISSCGDSGFDPPSLVLGPRLLAIVVEPPEAPPGQDVLLRALTASPDDAPLTLEWSIDLGTRALASGAGQAIGAPAEPLVLVAEGDGARIPGIETERAIAALLALVAGAEPGTPEHVVRLVYEEVGLPVIVNVTVRDTEGTIVVEGFKRFFLSPRAIVTSNPPPPRFAVGSAWLGGRIGDDPSLCVPEGQAPSVMAGASVVIAPDEDEPWLETYRALDLDGRVIEGREAAFYSWFSTAGRFRAAVTRAPDRSVEWTAPEASGEHPIWLVVRDGHLGTSACRATVRVELP